MLVKYFTAVVREQASSFILQIAIVLHLTGSLAVKVTSTLAELSFKFKLALAVDPFNNSLLIVVAAKLKLGMINNENKIPKIKKRLIMI